MSAVLPPSIELHHLQAVVRAMHAVALTDGVHDAERVMLRGFYDVCQQEAHALASYDDLIGVPFDAATDAHAFDTDERKAVLIHSCLLLAYADGKYSAGERSTIGGFAKALGVSDSQLAALEEAVSDHLLQQISRISNTDALQEVAAEIAAK